MKMKTGIDDRPKNDADDGERKSSTDGCPMLSRHCRTLHVYASWTHQRNLVGPVRSLSGRCWGRRRDDWCLGDSWRLSSPCLRLRSGVLDLRWSNPWELGRSTAVSLEATDLGCDELVAVLDRLALDESEDLVRLVGKASLGACNSESSNISVSFLAAFAAAVALLRFLCAIALACAVQASGSQSWHTRQGLSWVQRGKPSFRRHCWQRRWLSFLHRKWELSGNFGCDSVDDDLSRDLSAIISQSRKDVNKRLQNT